MAQQSQRLGRMAQHVYGTLPLFWAIVLCLPVEGLFCLLTCFVFFLFLSSLVSKSPIVTSLGLGGSDLDESSGDDGDDGAGMSRVRSYSSFQMSELEKRLKEVQQMYFNAPLLFLNAQLIFNRKSVRM